MVTQPRSSHRIHGPSLWAALDAKRRQEGLSWRGVARVTGCGTQSLYTRLRSDGLGLHSNALVSLLVWLGRDEQIRDLIVDATPTADEQHGPTVIDRLAAALAEASLTEVQAAFDRVGTTIHIHTEEPQP